MRRLVLQTGVSIDGFVAGPDGSHDWGYGREDGATKKWKLESLRKAGAHLMGRVPTRRWPRCGPPRRANMRRR
jgi:hypothetical protein